MSAAARLQGEPTPSGGVVILQGEQHVSGSDEVMISTLLGSCVAACLYDPARRVGGMNHFLLPGRNGRDDGEGMRFGVHAMELLVNGLLCAGARRERLECKLFGGAQMLDGLSDVGRENSEFALAFLRAEGIRHLGGSLGGTSARRLQFWPACGRARQRVAGRNAAVFASEGRRTRSASQVFRDGGDVELF